MTGTIAAHAAENTEKVLQLIETFVATANAGNPEAHARTFNFPHVLISNGSASVWYTLEELRSGYLPQLMALRERGWARSVYDAKEIVQSDGSTFHVAVRFTRYDQQQTPLGTYDALYVVTCVNGHWGIQARSNFVPPDAGGAASEG